MIQDICRYNPLSPRPFFASIPINSKKQAHKNQIDMD